MIQIFLSINKKYVDVDNLLHNNCDMSLEKHIHFLNKADCYNLQMVARDDAITWCWLQENMILNNHYKVVKCHLNDIELILMHNVIDCRWFYRIKQVFNVFEEKGAYLGKTH